MSRLHSRIIRQSGNTRAAQAGYHPYGTADTPMTMPMTHVVFSGGGGATVQQMTGITTPNGAVIPATVPGRFGQVTISPTPGMPSPSMWH
jgi:hypothetical protein